MSSFSTKKEGNYDFRNRMCTPHSRIYMSRENKRLEDELEIVSGMTMTVECGDAVADLALSDFKDFFNTSFGIELQITESNADITARVVAEGLGENANGYMGRRITVSESGILIEAFDMRGIAQAFYSLEERMCERRAPYLKHGVTEERPAFSPRMIHSGYGLDEYPDEYLSVCAHHGYDAIIIFVKDSKHSAHGECDFCDIVRRAAKYGIDVYAYSYLLNFNHPCDPGAKELYGELYGGLFRDTPGLKGIIFVGESIEFPSRDERVSCRRHSDPPEDGIPDGKITPGWFPCYDYVDWITLVRDSIRAVEPDADVVFWTYNFDSADPSCRAELLYRMPTDISLLVTFEMGTFFPMGNGSDRVADYTISHIGPAEPFVREAIIAKERGFRLYSQVNTGGRTWDFGVAPYEPFPYQWNERHEKILMAREKYGLSGLMESHHFGFLPSFISRIAKSNYTLGAPSFEEKLESIAMELAGEEHEKFIEAMKPISDSVKHYVPSDENQYGAYRIGPAYPFCIARECKLPNEPGVHFGNRIYEVINQNFDGWGRRDPYALCMKAEMEEERTARELVRRGLSVLRTIKSRTAELERIINLVHFIEKCYTTAINAHEFQRARADLVYADTKPKLARAIKRIERIAKREIDNVISTIPIVERDSSIGFEPSMAYQCDRRALEWKLKQMDYMLNIELSVYRRSVYPESTNGKILKF